MQRLEAVLQGYNSSLLFQPLPTAPRADRRLHPAYSMKKIIAALAASVFSLSAAIAQTMPAPTVAARSVKTADSPAVSEVFGRGSQVSRAPGASVGLGSLDVGDFGRGSGVLAKASAKPGAADTAIALAK